MHHSAQRVTVPACRPAQRLPVSQPSVRPSRRILYTGSKCWSVFAALICDDVECFSPQSKLEQFLAVAPPVRTWSAAKKDVDLEEAAAAVINLPD